ncbi:MAG: efflux RND transporter permease subunit, partial [Oleibacter sp.]|nr:efflux RND transporter permease subunit [Thalassolituus sp.]
RSDVVEVRLDPARLNGYGLTFDDVRQRLLSANHGGFRLPLVQNNEVIEIQAGTLLNKVSDIRQLVVGQSQNGIVYLADVADINQVSETANNYVQHKTLLKEETSQTEETSSLAAVTLVVAKKPGSNAIDITQAIRERLIKRQNTLIPDAVQVEITRDYGQTAKDKSDKLIAKLLFATAAVVVLVLATMSWREAIIVGTAILITLAITLFASWSWGFTLNRVSLFALIFSIGILVDDAIVVVENIHRRMQIDDSDMLDLIPVAVDEVGSPTILATFTVIAALMPMAFVSGLMGPYMSPIPINASAGMIISLVVAFVVTPWLSFKLLKRHALAGHSQAHTDQTQPQEEHGASAGSSDRLYRFFNTLMRPFIEGAGANKKRILLFVGITGLIVLAVALPVAKIVVLKMLPFDNKSEFQVVVDMPEGTPLEQTLAVLEDLGNEVLKHLDVQDVQLYAGTSAPINFNGMVRQYYLRDQPYQGDVQVNLVDKHHREQQSHDIARSLRESLQRIGERYHANVKIVEVPPGPPVIAPIVAEVYGPDYDEQIAAAKLLRAQLENDPDIVDVDDMTSAPQRRWLIDIDRQRATQLGVSEGTIVSAIQTALGGEDVTYLHNDLLNVPLPVRLELREEDKTQLNNLMTLRVKSSLPAPSSGLVALSDLISIHESIVEQPRYRKNLQSVVFVTADMAGTLDSPLYGLFRVAANLENEGLNWPQWLIQAPPLADQVEIKWDGEWQITYETFRDMGMAYGVGMILIYLLVVAQFRSYVVPLVIMAPIPLTVIGVLPGHALFNAQFTATSMIGMIALAGIIVRNSILLVDFINQQLAAGVRLEDAVVRSAAVRARPIVLTGVAAMIGAMFILDDPIFNGLAIALIFGILVSTMLTLVLIPLMYFMTMKSKVAA